MTVRLPAAGPIFARDALRRYPRSGHTCRQCHLKFKTGTLAALMAVLLPGGGYFYIRQPFLGAMSAITEITLLAVIGTVYSNLIYGDKPFLLVGAVALFILEKIVVAVHAGVFTKEFVPRNKRLAFSRSAIRLPNEVNV